MPDRAVALGERLAGAARALAAQPEQGWAGVSTGVVAAVRSASRRSWPVDADVSDLVVPAPPGRVQVGDRVLRVQLGRAVGAARGCGVADVALRLDGQRLVGVDLDVVARYGQELHALAAGVRATVLVELGTLLGPDARVTAVDDVVVRIGDVSPGDPRTT